MSAGLASSFGTTELQPTRYPDDDLAGIRFEEFCTSVVTERRWLQAPNDRFRDGFRHNRLPSGAFRMATGFKTLTIHHGFERAMPLEGIRVIELGVWIQGPLAGQILADLGAIVIKVERPAVGDPSRGLATLYGAPMLWEGRALLWELCNRNKRSMAIDPIERTGEHHETLATHIQKADQPTQGIPAP